ncbi:MGH1-like glycoside hydrolase domain-containing protein [Candidatus Soleaferrea massiliensis]|uniref:MGH1-like glycoside hydrolase domain-containing protein n=1 Tax=Candidatus Soleaferrea massiliensis TaxID=1470354 RepID=UPI00058E7DA2|nr:trehalase family glycosidase [Candidatus Soleaferrea massiliensis]
MKRERRLQGWISALLAAVMILGVCPASAFAYDPDKVYPNPFTYDEEKLPEPILDSHPEWVELYYKTWDIAQKKVQFGTKENGFVDAYMDEGFGSSFYLWDTAYIILFGKYSNNEFPSIVSLENLYRKQDTDGFIGKSYSEWNGSCDYAKDNTQSRNPPLLAWTEWESYRITGDRGRFLKEVTANQTDDSTKTIYQRLIDYYYWMKDWNRYENGFYWTSTRGSGMTGSPRLGCRGADDTGDGSWICLAGQMALSAKCMINIAEVLGDRNNIERFEREYQELSDLINNYMWDEEDGFYYDLDKNGDFYRMKTPAAFWPVLAGVASKEQVARMAEYLLDPDVFNRLHMVPSVGADHPAYNPALKWNGDVWAPMVYMVVEALNGYGLHDLARLVSENHITVLEEVYQDYGTLFEKYNADALRAGDGSKSDFVGWTGLGPISMLIENAIGIRLDTPENTIRWNLSQTSRNGLKNIELGDANVSMVADARGNADSRASITVETDKAFTLLVTIGGKEYTIEAQPGKHTYEAGEQVLPAPDTASPLYNVQAGAYIQDLGDGNLVLSTEHDDSVETVDIGGGYFGIRSLATGRYYAVSQDGRSVSADADSITRGAKFQICDLKNGNVVIRSITNAGYLAVKDGVLTVDGTSTKDTAVQFRFGEGDVNIDAQRRIASAEDVSVTCLLSAAPQLPDTVKVLYTDGMTGYAKVDWEDYDWAAVDQPQTVVIEGAVEDSEIMVEATVEVIDASGRLEGTLHTYGGYVGSYEVDFTKAGPVDWAHFGSPSHKYTSHKKDGPRLISDIATASNAGYEDFKNQMPLSAYWTDGSVDEKVSGDKGNWWIKDKAWFTIDADYIERHAAIYAFYKTHSSYTIKATLVDAQGNPVEGVQPYIVSPERESQNAYKLAVIELDFQAYPDTGSGQKILFEFDINEKGAAGKFFGIYGAAIADSDGIPEDVTPSEPVPEPDLKVQKSEMAVNLSMLGTKDWMHLGAEGQSDVKNSPVHYLSAEPLNASAVPVESQVYSCWTDGTSRTNAINVRDGMRSSGADAGWKLGARVRAGDTLNTYFETNGSAVAEVYAGSTLLDSRNITEAGAYRVSYRVPDGFSGENLALNIRADSDRTDAAVTLTSLTLDGTADIDYDIDVDFEGNTGVRQINLSEIGTRDWIHLGGVTSSGGSVTDPDKMDGYNFNIDRKVLVMPNLSVGNYGSLARINTFVDAAHTCSWNDGNPTMQASGVTRGVNWRGAGGAGGGFQLHATLDPQDELTVLLGSYKAQSETRVYVNGSPQPSYTRKDESNAAFADILKVVNREAEPIEITVVREQLTGTGGNVFLVGAAITGENLAFGDELLRLKNYVALLRPERYVQAVADQIRTAVAAAEAALSNPDADWAQVAGAYRALQAAFAETSKSANIIPVEKDALNVQIEQAKADYRSAVDAGIYTQESLRLFSAAIDAAVYDASTTRYALQREVDTAYENLITASEELKTLPADLTVLSDEYRVDNENRYISGISFGITAGELLSDIRCGDERVSIAIAGEDGSPAEDQAIVRSGMQAQLIFEGEVLESYSLSVVGDLGLSERPGIQTLLTVKSCILGYGELSELQRLSADADGNGKINVLDLLRIKLNILNAQY